MSFLFESVEGGAVRGRYSIIGLLPDLVWRAWCDRRDQSRRDPGAGAVLTLPAPSTRCLRELIAECRIELPPELPPPAAGLFGYLGYDMVRQMERLPDINPDVLSTPDAILIRPTIIVVFDSVKDHDHHRHAGPPRTRRIGKDGARARNRTADGDCRCARCAAAQNRCAKHQTISGTLRRRTRHRPNMRRWCAVPGEYIAAGDVFQVVLSQRFSAPFDLPPFSLYRALRRVNPAPFLYFLDFDSFSIAGSSPEILVRVSRWARHHPSDCRHAAARCDAA